MSEIDEGAIRNHAQARTAEQYLDALDEQLLDNSLCLVDRQYKQYEVQVIQIELDHFHEHRSIRLVVDNKEEETTC